MKMDQESVLQLLPAYALGALEADEMAAMAGYIETQRHLLARVAEAEDAAALMAYAAPQAQPPAQVRQRLVARLARDPLAVDTVPPEAPRQVPHAERRWHWGWLQAMGTAVAAAAILATIGLGLYASSLQTQVATAAARLDAVTAARDTLAGQNAVLVQDLVRQQEQNQSLVTQNQALAQHERQIAQSLETTSDRLNLVGSANAAVILNSASAALDSRGAFYVSGPEAAVVIHGLEPLPPDRIYQLWWVTTDGRQLPVAPVTVQAGVEPTWALFQVPENIPPFAVVGISVEPATGSPIPTGPMIVEGGQG